jgi:hypothetical protein
MSRRVAIVQSSYIPWKGYFDLMRRVDEFILYDDVQYTRRDWRNRNLIKTQHGLHWLTVPVDVKGKYTQLIKDVRICDAQWADRHFKTIAASYARAPYFNTYRDALEEMYRGARSAHLSEINRRLLETLCGLLGISTRLTWSMDYELRGDKVERLISLCRQAGATAYLSGPAARDYIDPATFAAAGITLDYMDYDGYPEYPQLHPPFAHGVSIIDLLVSVGPAALDYMLPLRRSPTQTPA